MSTFLELAGFALFLTGMFVLLGWAGAVLGAGLVFMIVGFAVGEPS